MFGLSRIPLNNIYVSRRYSSSEGDMSISLKYIPIISYASILKKRYKPVKER